jgi:hypothetical protein
MQRRQFLMGMLAAPLVAAQAADTPSLVLVLVDASLTIPDLKDFRKAWKTVSARAVGGDRVVVAVVSGHVGKSENSALTETGDLELPLKGWNDNPFTYDESLTAAKNELSTDFEAALAKPRPDRTELMRSIRDAGRYFGGEKKRRKLLVILSDMLQDSAEYQFTRISVSETFTKNVIAKAQKDQLLPDLHGVTVYTQVPGVAAPAKADEVQRFWIAYLSAAGARIDQQTYGTLTNYRRL